MTAAQGGPPPIDPARPRLGRLLPRREAVEQLDAFAPLLPGHGLEIVDVYGVQIASSGTVRSPSDGAAAWRAAIALADVELGEVRVVPPPADAIALAAADALVGGLRRSVNAAAVRRELVAETLERYREVSLLYRLGDVLGDTLDPAALPARVLDEALRLIPTDGAALVVDADGDEPSTWAASAWVASGSLAGPHGPQVLEATRSSLSDAARPAILGGSGGGDVSLWAPLRARERTLGGVLLTRPSGAAMFTAGDAKLLSALATQAAAYLDNARLHQRSLAQARMAQELQLAHDVQARLMPRVMPDRGGWRVAASWMPAREVAGDFFDAIGCERDIAIAVGDVADKGMAAALFMALTRSVLRASTGPGRSAGDVVGLANALLCADATDGMFVTLVYALLEPDGAVRYANAGHNPPFVVRRDGAVESLGRTGILVGWDERATYTEARTALAAGDVLVLYTDGVTEARDAAGAEYGEERFVRTATAHRARGAGALLRALLDDLEGFVGGAEPYDDATIMVVAREVDTPT